MKQRSYHKYDDNILRRVREFVSTDELKGLHRIVPWRHFAIAGRHILLYGLCAWALPWSTIR